MTCTHKRLLVWKRKGGYTRKCLECGMLQYFQRKPTMSGTPNAAYYEVAEAWFKRGDK